MNPADLLAPPSPLGFPAPYWFMAFFKVLGFSLHAVPMNLWYAGILLAMLLWWSGEHGRTWSTRLMNRMPVIIAFGVNFGIVPLLFVQTAYYRVFYPATILMAWFWLSVIGLLTLAYYGVYLYVIALRAGNVSRFHRAVGWISALFFIGIGFVFANGLSLMNNVAGWPEIWRNTSISGAALGTALNIGDRTLWPRWLMMFGLALTTVAAYTAFETAYSGHREGEGYVRWAGSFALKLCAVGVVWYGITALWYMLGTWPHQTLEAMFAMPRVPLTVLTGAGPVLVLLLLWLQRRGATRRVALATGFAQFGVVGLNAISRQLVQNLELAPYLNLMDEPVHTQWSSLIPFLVFFLVGVGVLVWMVMQAVAVNRREATAPSPGPTTG